MNKLKIKKRRTDKRKVRIKSRIKSSAERLRMCISKSNKNFYIQIVDDKQGKTLVALSTLSKDFPEMKNTGNISAAKTLGKLFAEKAVKAGIKKVVFDRNGYLYHGKIKAFADSARENGLEF